MGAIVVLPKVTKTLSNQPVGVDKRVVSDKYEQRQNVIRSANAPENLKSLSFEILSRNGSTLKLKTG